MFHIVFDEDWDRLSASLTDALCHAIDESSGDDADDPVELWRQAQEEASG